MQAYYKKPSQYLLTSKGNKKDQKLDLGTRTEQRLSSSTDFLANYCYPPTDNPSYSCSLFFHNQMTFTLLPLGSCWLELYFSVKEDLENIKRAEHLTCGNQDITFCLNVIPQYVMLSAFCHIT